MKKLAKINSLELKNICKVFPGIVANNNINFKIQSGEIHAILGENGAGKTTLMNILYGIYTPTKGDIYINGKKVYINSPRIASNYGIGMVHQHFMLIENHSVLENIALSLNCLPLFNPLKKTEEIFNEFCDKYSFKIDPLSRIWQLSAGEKQKLEILKALIKGADLLILDEPTSVLTGSEAEELLQILKNMKASDKSIIYITHKLDEVIKVSDKITVLKDGEIAGLCITEKTTKEELAYLMVGRNVVFNVQKPSINKGKKMLDVQNISVTNDRGLLAIKDLTFDICEGEIFGICGVSGNGQRELVEALTGMRKTTKGQIILKGKNIENTNPKTINELGVCHIPEERLRFGVVGDLLVSDNLILKAYDRPPFFNGIFIDKKAVLEMLAKAVKEYDISTGSTDCPINLLSGGNIQKLIIAREFMMNPKLIIASHPTYGLDVGAIEHVRKLLLAKREEGSAVLLVSEDLEELLSISDRIAVIFNGEFMDVFENTNKIDITKIGLMMAGIKSDVEN